MCVSHGWCEHAEYDGGQVAAGLIKASQCTEQNNEEAESMTIGDHHEAGAMPLYKASGPFKLLWHLEG